MTKLRNGYTAHQRKFGLLQRDLPSVAPTPVSSARPAESAAAREAQKVYAAAAARFARRHAEGGGRAHTYRIDWGSKTNGFGATHAIDLPLLFGDQQAWAEAELVRGVDWAEIHSSGRAVRELWSDFARTGSLLDHGRVEPNVLSYTRIQRREFRVGGEAQSEQVSALDRQVR